MGRLSTTWVWERLAEERERWPLWGPVFLGGGASAYFALSAPPPAWVGGVAAGFFLCVLALGRRRPGIALPALAVALAAAGFALAAWRAERVAEPVLEWPTRGAVAVGGIVAGIEPLPTGGGRVTLDEATVATPGVVPVRLRVQVAASLLAGTGGETARVGDRVRVRAVLRPPSAPAMPGAYDFARRDWFLGLGATGYAVSPLEVAARGGAGGGRRWLDRLRQTVAGRIRAQLPGPEGGVAVALTTGQTSGIPAPVLAYYRESGLAHILVIAGLHMGLVAGLVFLVVRGGLALWPAVALRWPIKKWAAVAALMVTGGYMALAGLPVPATRAFVMAAVVLVGVLIDRRALSIRLLALAATAILVLEPEEVAGPSFQMSFAAVLTLIAVWEVAGPPLAALRRRWRGALAARLGLWLARMALTSLAAGAATTVYGLYHFNRVAVFQLAANLLAVPVTGVAVMPFALAALILMPLGLERLALVPLGLGIRVVDAIAAWVSGWPGAQLMPPVLSPAGLAVFTLGGLWLCLWRGNWRFWGLGPMALGLASLALSHPPDILVDDTGRHVAVRTADGALLVSGGGAVLKDIWGRRAGPLAAEPWPRQGQAAGGRLDCEASVCLYRARGQTVAFVRDRAGLDQVCAGPAVRILVSAEPVRRECPAAALVIDRFDVWRRGAHAVWLDKGGAVRVETAADGQGRHPWRLDPHPRPRRARSRWPDEAQ